MPAFVEIRGSVFVAQDERDILLAELKRLEEENARLTLARADDAKEIERIAAIVAEISAASNAHSMGEVSSGALVLIVRSIIFPEAVTDDDMQWAKSKIAEIKYPPAQKSGIPELLDALHDCVNQACLVNGEYDSMALSAYADALELLEEHGRVKITEEFGRRVIAVPVEPAQGQGANGR